MYLFLRAFLAFLTNLIVTRHLNTELETQIYGKFISFSKHLIMYVKDLKLGLTWWVI